MQKMKLILQTVFKILKFKKSCTLIGQEHFCSQLKKQSLHRRGFHRITKATMDIIWNRKKLMLMEHFFKNLYCSFVISEQLGHAWLNNQPFPKILIIFYFRALWAYPSVPDYTQQILHDETVPSMDI